jgi:diguanylate cyclase (GGDEF)-like protein/PAS domain S-box-containing protein
MTKPRIPKFFPGVSLLAALLWVAWLGLTGHHSLGLPSVLLLLAAMGAWVVHANRRADRITDHTDTLHRILETSLDGFWLADARGWLKEVNPAYCQRSGYTRAELLTLNITHLEATEPLSDPCNRTQQLIQQGRLRFETLHRHKNGSTWPVEVSTAYSPLEGGQIYAFLRDLTSQKQAQQSLEEVAHYDPLTRLPNRHLLADRMSQKLAHGQRMGELVLVCLLDLDGFKQVNDQLGHQAGDQLLCEVAQRLLDSLRAEDTAARLGGDEFVLLLGGFITLSEAQATLERVLTAVAAPYQVLGQIARVSGSMGVALFPNEGSDPDLLLRLADQAMYKAKKAGKNRFELSDPSHELHRAARKGTIAKIARALEKDQFELLYQPKVNTREGTVASMEALVRWRHPVLGLMTPPEFMPLVEQEDLVLAVDDWVLARALEQQRQWWLDHALAVPLSINLSSRLLLDAHFDRRLRQRLDGHPADLRRLVTLDVAESLAIENLQGVVQAIAACHDLGLSVALDDFGTGYSSMVHLKRLAVDELKIDTSFTAAMLGGPQDLAMVQSVIGLGAAFRRQVSAEGVETLDQLLVLMELGCDLMQGYAIARPMPAAAVVAWVRGFVPDVLWNLSIRTRPTRAYFELLLAETNHRPWVEKRMHQALSAPPDGHEADLLSAEQCRFAQWLQEASNTCVFNLDNFEQLKAQHAALHACAQTQVHHRRLGQETAATVDETELRQHHLHFQTTVQHLRMQTVQSLSEPIASEGDAPHGQP